MARRSPASGAGKSYSLEFRRRRRNKRASSLSGRTSHSAIRRTSNFSIDLDGDHGRISLFGNDATIEIEGESGRLSLSKGNESIVLNSDSGHIRLGEPGKSGGVLRSVIAGTAGMPVGSIRAFRWTESEGLQYVKTPENWVFTTPHAVSGNGAVLVGDGTIGGRSRGIRWTQHGSMNLGVLPGGIESGAAGVSADGATVVGYCNMPVDTSAPFLWTYASGMVDLGNLSQHASERHGAAFAISADATTVVGYSWAGFAQPRAFRWRQASGMVNLGALGGQTSYAYSVSGDGSIVVGAAHGGSNSAFIWDEARGMRRLRDVLSRDYGLDVRGWCLSVARGISADGSVIVGEGTDPSDTAHGWVARLGAPLDTPACDADWNRDGFVNGTDFDEYVQAFEAGNLLADFDGIAL